MQNKKEKIIIAGGAGFIGKNLIKKLSKNKQLEIHIIDWFKNEFTNQETYKEFKKIFKDQENIIIHKKDIRDFDSIKDIFKEAKTVIHLAAFISATNSINEPKECFSTNISGTINIFEAARINSVHNVIFASSAAVYGSMNGKTNESKKTHPESPYGLSKYIDELIGKMYSELYSMNIVGLRFSNVWGNMQHNTGNYAPVIGRFIKQIQNNENITIFGDGNQTRDFIHVEDVANAIELIMKKIKSQDENNIFEVFNISTNKETKIKNIAEMVLKIKKNKEIKIIYEKARKEPKKSIGDNSKIKKFIDWEPKKILEKGIKELI
ncbi:MAG: GDP-mannose 4,6-dehydratase [Candidatus Nomurabacteria bacterium]